MSPAKNALSRKGAHQKLSFNLTTRNNAIELHLHLEGILSSAQ